MVESELHYDPYSDSDNVIAVLRRLIITRLLFFSNGLLRSCGFKSREAKMNHQTFLVLEACYCFN